MFLRKFIFPASTAAAVFFAACNESSTGAAPQSTANANIVNNVEQLDNIPCTETENNCRIIYVEQIKQNLQCNAKLHAWNPVLSGQSIEGCQNDVYATNTSNEPNTDTGNNSSNASSNKLASCYMVMESGIITTHTCIEADISLADSVQMMCEAYTQVVAKAELGNGCPAGAVKTCTDKDENEEAKIYFYDALFANMTCEELLEDDEDDIDIDPYNQSSYSSETTIACTNTGICGEGPKTLMQCDESIGDIITEKCPAGGEFCDIGIDRMKIYIYPESNTTCESIKQYF